MGLLYATLLVIFAGFVTMIAGLVKMLSGLFDRENRFQKALSALGIAFAGFFIMVLGVVFQPRMIRSPGQGKLTACKSNLKNIGTALEMYSTDYDAGTPRHSPI